MSLWKGIIMDDAPRTTLQSNRNQVLLIVAAAAVIAGSIGPWASVWVVTVNGTSGDGVLTLIAGIMAGILAFVEFGRSTASRGRTLGMLILFGGSATLGAYHWINFADLARHATFPTTVGWGLPVLTIAGIVGVITSFVALGEINRQTPESAVYDPATDSDLPSKSRRTMAVVALICAALVIVGVW